jgi:hypothetical protein
VWVGGGAAVADAASATMMRRAGELPRVLAKHLLDGSDPGRQTEALKGVVHSLPKQSSPKVRLLDAASPFAGSGRLRSLSHRHPCVTTGSRHPKCPAHDVSCARSFVITMSSLHQFTRCFSAYQRNPYGMVPHRLRSLLRSSSYSIPEKVRFSIGWPKRAASCGAISECWATEASSDRQKT